MSPIPNFAIPDRIRATIIQQVTTLAERPCAEVRTLFPLDFQEVQDLILDRDTCNEMQRLIDKGVKTISKYDNFRVGFFSSKIPELKRSTIVNIRMPVVGSGRDQRRVELFVKYATQYGILNEINYETDISDKCITASLNQLPNERRGRLVWWLEKALHQERIKEVAVQVTKTIIKQHAPTSTHLQVLCPALARVLDPSAESHHADQRYLEQWVSKLRNPARALYNYLPESWVEATYKPLFPVLETAIAAGKLVGRDIQQDRNKIYAMVEHWQRLPKDVKFPLRRKDPKPPTYGEEDDKIIDADIDDINHE